MNGASGSPKTFKRWYARIAAGLLACVTGCSGALTQSGVVPGGQPTGDSVRGARLEATLSLHIPRHRTGTRGPSAVDVDTKSVVVVVNALRAQIFETTATSPGCSSSATGITCGLKIAAPPGKDTISASTYDGPDGTGNLLDWGEIGANIQRGKSNNFAMKLGHVIKVTNVNDSGNGSLRDAVADVKSGDVINFDLALPATIALTSGAIKITKNMSITGPGSNDLTVTANGASQILVVSTGVTAVVSDLTLSAGVASTASPIGGAVYNAGSLTLNSDDVAASTATSASRSRTPRYAAPKIRFDPRPRSHDERPPRHPRAAPPPRPHVVSSASGGGIYNAGVLSVNASTVYGNSVGEGNGGAIYNAAGATLVVSSSSFLDNSGGIGGAIDNEGTATLKNDAFSNNSGWAGSGTPLTGGWGYGAAVYSDGNLTVVSSTFTSNTAGGASQASNGIGGAIAQYAGTLSVSGSTFTSNAAGGGTDGSWGYGGAIFYGGSNLSIASATFSKNTAGGDAFGYGGAIFSTSGLSSSGNTFSHNAAAGSSSSGYAYAGAIYSDGAVTLNNDAYNGNAATAGGYGYAGAVDGESDSTIKNTSFANNSVSAGGGGTAIGGAVFTDGSGTWTNATFSGNTATAGNGRSYAAGGAAALYAPATVSGSTLSGNTAGVTSASPIAAVGGAIAVEEGPFSFTGTMSGNTATTEGGAIWVDDTATLANSTFNGNQVATVAYANDGGGGVYNSPGGNLIVTGTTINGNSVSGKAGSSGGGGMFNAGSLTMTNSTITNNTSAVDGGGLENDATTGVSITNVTIYQNNASGSGPNLKNLYADAAMSIGSSIVAGGSSSSSSGNNDVSNDGTITSNDYNIIEVSDGNDLTGQTGNNLAAGPKLSGLANNGGPTKTNADAKSSPGAAYIPYSVCQAAGITVDQRGDPRNGQGGGFCDVGAYEFQ